MSSAKQITKTKAACAVAVAIAADIAQLFTTPLTLFFGIAVEGVDLAIDAAAAVAITRLLGFDWVLMPTFVIELVPLVYDIPTWTGCAVYLLWKRNKEGRFLPDAPH